MAHNSGDSDNLIEEVDEDEEMAEPAVPTFFRGNSTMKPKFDAMLKEIEQNLPSLDDEDSDFEEGSGDEIEIFQRPSSYGHILDDADKDLDESLTSSELSGVWNWKPSNSANTDNVQHSSWGSIPDDHLSANRSSDDYASANRNEDDENISTWRPAAISNDAQSWLHDSNRNADIQSSFDNRDLESLMSGISFSSHQEPRIAWEDGDNESSPRIPSPRVASPQISSPRVAQSPRSRRHRTSRPSRRDAARNRNSRSTDVDLSLGSLENVDLDLALQNVVEDEYRRHQRSRSSSLDLFDLKPGDNMLSSRDPNKCTEIMQSLVKLSVQQSGQKIDIDPMSGAERRSVRKEKPLSKYEADAIGEKGVYATSESRSSCGVSTDNHQGRQPQATEPVAAVTEPVVVVHTPARNTVFLDLRKSSAVSEEDRHRQAVVQRVLGINLDREDDSDSSSSDMSASDDQTAWLQHRKKVREALERRDVASASSLRDTANVPTTTLPTSSKQEVKQEQEAASPSSAAAISTSASSASAAEDRSEETIPVKEEDSKKKTEGRTKSASSKKKRGGSYAASADDEDDESAARQREIKKRVDEEYRRQLPIYRAKKALLDDLMKSVQVVATDSKRKAAPATFPLYHIDLSHEPPSPSLPMNFDKQEDFALLTVQLSSNGEIAFQRVLEKGVPDPYILLVAWLCSKIPDDIENPTSKDEDDQVIHPFHVVGLQQMVVDKKLMLAAVVVPSSNDLSFLKPGRVPKKDSQKSAFVQQIAWYLRTKTLKEIMSCSESDVESLIEKSQIFNKPLSTFINVETSKSLINHYFRNPYAILWTTVATEELNSGSEGHPLNNAEEELDINTTYVQMRYPVFSNPNILAFMLSDFLKKTLDIAGLRLSWPTTPTGEVFLDAGTVLLVAIRGPWARRRWLDTLEFHQKSDASNTSTTPNTIMAATIICGSQVDGAPNVYTPRSSVQITNDLIRWFGGRVSEDQISRIMKCHKSSSKSAKDLASIVINPSSISLLSATTSGDVFIIVSPFYPTKYLGKFLQDLINRGFLFRGIRRRRLSQKQVFALGIPAEFAKYIAADVPNPSSSSQTPSGATPSAQPSSTRPVPDAPKPSTIILCSKENALHHMEVTLSQLHRIYSNFFAEHHGLLDDHPFFYSTPYHADYLTCLGGDFSKVPDRNQPVMPGYIAPKLYYNSELEQVSVMSLVGRDMSFSKLTFMLSQALGVTISRSNADLTEGEGLELLGIKWIPALSEAQAEELSPYQSRHDNFKSSVKELKNEPALVSVFRGINCSARLKEILEENSFPLKLPLKRTVSSTPEYAYRLLSMFYFDRELFADSSCSRPLKPYLPPLRNEFKPAADIWDDESAVTKKTGGKGGKKKGKTPPITPPSATHFTEESIFKMLEMGPRPITTLLVVKPFIMAKRNLARLFKELLRESFCFVALRLVTITETEAVLMQPETVSLNEKLRKDDIDHMTSASSLVMVLFRENAVKKLLELVGPVDPEMAKELNPDSWRARYGTSLVKNGFYASTSYDSAVADVKHFFKAGLCCIPTVDTEAEGITTYCVDDIINCNEREAVERVLTAPDPHNLNRLNEVNCIVLTFPLLRVDVETHQAKFTDVLDCLQTMELDICGARCIWLTEDQAQEYLHISKAGSFELVPLISNSPALVLAVQGSNAVIAYKHIIETGMLKIGKNKDDYMTFIHAGKNLDMANKLLAFFFDELLGENCKMKICKKDSAEEQVQPAD